jgi:small subunit ribosomal protein S20
VQGNDQEAAMKSAELAISALDKAAQKGVIHKNNAARRKSRLVKLLASLKK